MRDGRLNRGQVQAWALNRYYYQARIPAKDAYLVARLPTPALRREWRRRIIDHDGESEGHRRDRALAQADRRARPRSRLCGLDRRAVAGHPLCGRRLCQFRPRPLAARSGRLVPDRNVLAGDHRRAGRGPAEELRFRQPRHARLFHAAADPGADRRRLCSRLRQGARRYRRRSRRSFSTPCGSNATCCGRSSTRSISPMSSRV